MSASPAPPDAPQTESKKGFKVESLARGLSLLLVLMVLQRMIGFGRNVLFCRWLSPAELGRWNLSFSLVVLAAPLVVIGLPGSFGRYVEHYRKKGQLRSFLRRTTALTVVLSLIGISMLCTTKRTAAWLFFGDAEQTELLLVTLVSLVAVIGFNFINELFTSLRQLRTVSYLQFANGLLFGIFALGLLHVWDATAYAIIIGYALACFTTCLLAVVPLFQALGSIKDSGTAPPQSTLWAKLIPFAAWIWFSDLLGNLFAAADRYMIVHFSSPDPETATAVVGQYHSSLVVPTLLLAVATMVASVVLPYVSSDWESGNHASVAKRLNLAIKSYGLVALLAALGVLTFSSWIFGWALGGKYADGLAVLPWTLAFCIWGGMSVIARSYLLCVEKAGAGTMGPLVGLLVNVVLNFLLLPRYGLLGAVWATAAGNVTTLVISYYYSALHGFTLERGTIILSFLPICLTLKTPAATGCILAILFISLQREWLLSAADKKRIIGLAEEKLRNIFQPIWRRMRKTTA